MPEPSELTELEQRFLGFERRWSGRLGAKEAAIRAEFGCSAARYYQQLDAMIDDQRVEQADPVLVHRLQRLRDARAADRAARVLRRTA